MFQWVSYEFIGFEKISDCPLLGRVPARPGVNFGRNSSQLEQRHIYDVGQISQMLTRPTSKINRMNFYIPSPSLTWPPKTYKPTLSSVRSGPKRTGNPPKINNPLTLNPSKPKLNPLKTNLNPLKPTSKMQNHKLIHRNPIYCFNYSKISFLIFGGFPVLFEPHSVQNKPRLKVRKREKYSRTSYDELVLDQVGTLPIWHTFLRPYRINFMHKLCQIISNFIIHYSTRFNSCK